MAFVFGVLADPNRLRLLSALASQELCVCDLAALTKMTESAVSHQLRLLLVMRLVSYRREGRNADILHLLNKGWWAVPTLRTHKLFRL